MQDLIAAARKVRKNAYAPHSRYQVGAAVLGADGQVYVGCNVENATYGATICAERAAICAMVAAGCQRFEAIAVVTRNGGTPCGICRQVLAEFAGDGNPAVVCASDQGEADAYTVGDLLPKAFAFQTEPEP